MQPSGTLSNSKRMTSLMPSFRMAPGTYLHMHANIIQIIGRYGSRPGASQQVCRASHIVLAGPLSGQ